MTIEQDLAEWAATRHDWQQGILSGLCRGEIFPPEAIAAIADQLITGQTRTLTPLRSTDIPGNADTDCGTVLDALRDLVGVNVLAPDQSLTFGRCGLTIVYGDNASGKSGYARLIRQAVSSRPTGAILGNVFDATQPAVQQAVVEYSAGQDSTPWKWPDAPCAELQRVHFYDEDDGNFYIANESEISYRPSALLLLDQLITVCDAVRQELDSRLRDLDTARGPMPTVRTCSGTW